MEALPTIPERFNICEQVVDRWSKTPKASSVAILYKDEEITYRRLVERIEAAVGLLSSLGLKEGDTFILHLSNRPEFAYLTLAGMRLGAIATPASILLGEVELRSMAKGCRPSLVISHKEALSLWEAIVREEGLKCEVLEARIPSKPRTRLSKPRTKKDDPAFILHSSGSTGRPKGILHAHRWLIGAGYGVGSALMGLGDGEVVYCPHDITHIQAFGAGFLFPLYFGATILLDDERVTPERSLTLMERHKVTILKTVTAFVRRLLGFEPKGFRLSLKRCVTGTEPVSKELYERWRRSFGCELLEGFGQTELSIFCGQWHDRPVKPGSFGRALPGHLVRIVDELGRELPAGRVGHLVVKEDDPALFLDYINEPSLRSKVIRNGWYYTGDLAYMDDEGYFWYVARADELFKSRGYTISPREVELALEEHEAVERACVIGLPDEALGKRIKAFIELKGGHEPSEGLAKELREWVRRRLAPYKAPKEIEFSQELPTTSTGKVLTSYLKERKVLDEAKRFLF